MNIHTPSLLSLFQEAPEKLPSIPAKAPWTIPLAGKQLSIRPLAVEITEQRIDEAVYACGKAGNAGFELKLPAETLELIVARMEPMITWEKLPAQAQALVLEQLFAPLIEAIENISARSLKFEPPVEKAPANFSPIIGFQVSWDNISFAVSGAFYNGLAKAVFDWIIRLPKPQPSPITTSIALRRGAAVLPYCEVKSLQIGDGIILGNSGQAPGYWAVTGNRHIAECSTENNEIKLVEPLLNIPTGTTRHLMADNSENSLPPASRGSAADIPIKLLFNAGNIEIPIGKLEEINEGHVFELGRLPTDAVEIVANGHVLGRGEIVVVDGLTAVRVSALYR